VSDGHYERLANFDLTTATGQFGFPGGHQEFGETYFQCAEREALEETGLAVTAIKLAAVTDSVFDDKAHYITLYVECRQNNPGEEPQVSSAVTSFW
jgi:8-oxo-dGTP diphosphatase